MANTKPSAFTTKTTAYADTKLISQVPGNSAAAEDCQFTLATLNAYFKGVGIQRVVSGTANSGSVGSLSIPANCIVNSIAVQSGGSGTVDIGTTSGGDEITTGLDFPTAPNPYVLQREVGSGGETLYFSGHTSTISFYAIISVFA